MKEFISAVADVEAEDERKAKIDALVAEGKSVEDAEAEVDERKFVEFKLDDRVMRAYNPNDGQLAFMLAALGRGQSQEGRFSAILNIMFSSLRPADQDYLEGRMLASDRKEALPMKQIEQIFEYLTEEWFRADVSGSGETVPDRE